MSFLGVGIYVKNSPKAIEMYCSAFGLEIDYHVLKDDNTYYHSDLLKDGGTVKLDICELPWSPCAAEVTDCFGVNWYLTMPQHPPADDWCCSHLARCPRE